MADRSLLKALSIISLVLVLVAGDERPQFSEKLLVHSIDVKQLVICRFFKLPYRLIAAAYQAGFKPETGLDLPSCRVLETHQVFLQ